MLHHVLSKLQPGSNKLCRKTGILCCASAFGIERNIFFRLAHVRCAYVCYSRSQSQYWWSITSCTAKYCPVILEAFLEKKNNNKKQDTNNLLPKGVPNVFSLLCTPRRHTLAKETQLYGHAPPPCSTTEAPHCTHSPRMRSQFLHKVFRNFQEVLHSKPAKEKS